MYDKGINAIPKSVAKEVRRVCGRKLLAVTPPATF